MNWVGQRLAACGTVDWGVGLCQNTGRSARRLPLSAGDRVRGRLPSKLEGDAAGQPPVHLASTAGKEPMSESLQIELNDRQRDLLLRGLRYVRSSRMLEFREMAEITEDERRDELGQIRQLCDLLDRKARKGEPAAV